MPIRSPLDKGRLSWTVGLALMLVPTLALAESDASTQVPTTRVQVCQASSPEVRFGTREAPGRLTIDLGGHLPEGATVQELELRVDLSTMLAVEIRDAGPLWRWADGGDWLPFSGQNAVRCSARAEIDDCPDGQRLFLTDLKRGGPLAAPSWSLELADPTGQVTPYWVHQACVTIDYWPAGRAPARIDQGPPLVLPDFGFGREPDAGTDELPGEAGIYAPLPVPQPDAAPGAGQSPLPARPSEEKSGCSATPGLDDAPLWALGALVLLGRRRRR